MHKGACFCGSVEIEVHGKSLDMGYCHCTSCRTHTGAPLVAYTIWRKEDVVVSKGADLLSGFNKVGTSNRKFCTRCGGAIFIDQPLLGVVDVPASLLPTLSFEPTAHLNYGERMMSVRDGLPKFKDMPREIGGSGELVAE